LDAGRGRIAYHVLAIEFLGRPKLRFDPFRRPSIKAADFGATDPVIEGVDASRSRAPTKRRKHRFPVAKPTQLTIPAEEDEQQGAQDDKDFMAEFSAFHRKLGCPKSRQSRVL
jgi:hypothetical protein